MSVTLADVAAKAGVSTMTVSNVLTGKSGKVSEKTARRVLDAVAETGYVVNASARALSAKSSHIVAIVVAGNGPILRGAHDSRMVGHITAELQKHGYNAMLIAASDIGTTIASLKSWRVDGGIVLNTLAHELESLHAGDDIPLLFVDSYIERPGVLSVRTDDYGGGHLAADHLIAHGHRDHVCFLGPIRGHKGVVDERFRGFADAYLDHDLPKPMVPFNISDTNARTGIELAPKFAALDPRPSAVFCSADDLAVGLMSGLAREGVMVPRDLSVVGFDGFDISLMATPALTTIGQNVENKARLAVSRLLAAIGGSETLEDSCHDAPLEVSLLERETVASIGV